MEWRKPAHNPGERELALDVRERKRGRKGKRGYRPDEAACMASLPLYFHG
jgi:hypothetical protein